MNFMHKLRETNKTFVIAEIGQNHQGDINIAKELIKIAKECGADCAKFQKTCLTEKFTVSGLNRPYKSVNSWGDTYGAHKAYLEFSHEEFIELQNYAQEINILLTASAMDPESLNFLKEITVPFIKIGSGDSNNLLLIEQAALTGIPLVISTGMINFDTVKRIYDLVSKYHNNFALLHCVSAYPTPYENINLNVLNAYIKEFPDIVIGYSGHEIGIQPTVCAVAIGAKIIERHITLDKKQKGSDHNCSLEPPELKQLIDQIRSIELAMGDSIKQIQNCELSCYEKLGKSLVYAFDFSKGHKLKKDDLKIKVSYPKGLDGLLFDEVVGKNINCNVKSDDPVLSEQFS
ncbi:sialic acid synthase [Sitophilus oryzae]|uniref:Sialic acid synthase n=1 Tax=Sitophilus oryzae TaxID=7048 RepID=A0A6J2XNF3_SITOR|nr:sialic acid synthase [Sitophilus oryzae]